MEILPKKCFEDSRAVSWSLSCYKELKLTIKPFTGRTILLTLQGLPLQMQNISLQSLGIHRKQNFEIVLRFKSDTAILTFSLRFLQSPPLPFCFFLPHFFFFRWDLVGFILVGKVFRKAFRILDRMKEKVGGGYTGT